MSRVRETQAHGGLTAAQRAALAAAADAELLNAQTRELLAAADFELTPFQEWPHRLMPCRQPNVDPESWWPLISTEITPGDDPTGVLARQERELAAQLCSGCPVVIQCLMRSLDISTVDYGICGQTGARDRAALRAQLREVSR
jgi:hypothetical protein